MKNVLQEKIITLKKRGNSRNEHQSMKLTQRVKERWNECHQYFPISIRLCGYIQVLASNGAVVGVYGSGMPA